VEHPLVHDILERALTDEAGELIVQVWRLVLSVLHLSLVELLLPLL